MIILTGRIADHVTDYEKIDALEGNSMTESETKVLPEDGLTVGGKPLRDVFETVGHGL